MLTAAVDTVLPTFRIYLRSDRPALIQADAQDKHERVDFRAAVQARNLPRSTVMSGELWRRPRGLLVVGEPRWPIPPPSLRGSVPPLSTHREEDGSRALVGAWIVV